MCVVRVNRTPSVVTREIEFHQNSFELNAFSEDVALLVIEMID